MKRIIDMGSLPLPEKVAEQLRSLQQRVGHLDETLSLQDGREGGGYSYGGDSEGLVMDRWSIEAFAYSQKDAASLGFMSRLLGGKVSRKSCGIVCEARRYTVVEREGLAVDIGVAVRICAAIEELKSGVQLTLPNLAASAQLDSAEARIEMAVLGYTGPLGSLLPTPRQLSVDCYVDYIKAFGNIQAVIFGADAAPHHAPTLLAYDVGPGRSARQSSPLPSREVSAGDGHAD